MLSDGAANAALNERASAEGEVLSRADLLEALKSHRFIPYFQPQVNYAIGKICGAETLVRMNHPKFGLLSPCRFVPRMEEEGIIYLLDREVWNMAMRAMRRWMDDGIHLPPISLNLSRRSLLSETLIDYITYLLKTYRVNPDLIHIEITESAFAADNETIQRVIDQLHQLGFQLEMDDFGSGYSNLNLLKDTFVDSLKLDGAFLAAGKNHKRGSSIISSIVRMAYDLHIRVIAEGVEHKYQAEFLKSIGCFVMQGYYFSRPITGDAFVELLQQKGMSTESGAIQVNEVGQALDFLDDTTQSALLFNSFVGGAYIFEYRGNGTTILRTNEKFFTELGVQYQDFYTLGEYSLIRLLRAESRARIIDALNCAIQTGEEQSCMVCSDLLHAGEETWLSMRLRCLANKKYSYIFYASVENRTEAILLSRRNNTLSSELNALISNIPGGLARFRFAENRFICEFMSKGFYAMRGYSEHELMDIMNKSTFGHIHPDDIDRVQHEVECSRINHSDSHIAFRVPHKDGHYMWIDMNSCYIRSANGDMLYCYCKDITDEKLLQRKYASTLRDIANLSNSVGGGIALYEIADGHLNLLDVSTGVAAMSGRTVEEFKRDFEIDPTSGIYPPDAKDLRLLIGQLVRLEKREFDTYYRAINKGGAIMWINLHGNVTTDEDGHILLNIAYRNLSSTTTLYHDIINAADTGVIVSRRDNYEILFINDAMKQLIGTDADLQNGAFCYSALYKKSSPCEGCALSLHANGAAEQKIFHGRTYKVVRRPIIWNGMDAIISYMYDITLDP